MQMSETETSFIGCNCYLYIIPAIMSIGAIWRPFCVFKTWLLQIISFNIIIYPRSLHKVTKETTGFICTTIKFYGTESASFMAGNPCFTTFCGFIKTSAQ